MWSLNNINADLRSANAKLQHFLFGVILNFSKILRPEMCHLSVHFCFVFSFLPVCNFDFKFKIETQKHRSLEAFRDCDNLQIFLMTSDTVATLSPIPHCQHSSDSIRLWYRCIFFYNVCIICWNKSYIDQCLCCHRKYFAINRCDWPFSFPCDSVSVLPPKFLFLVFHLI